jgi:Helix-turn-helix domain
MAGAKLTVGEGRVMTEEERDERLERIEHMLSVLVQRQTVKDFYAIDEFAELVGKRPFTVREWARNRRIHAEKRQSGRGAHQAWVISHAELLRFQRNGLLVQAKPTT